MLFCIPQSALHPLDTSSNSVVFVVTTWSLPTIFFSFVLWLRVGLHGFKPYCPVLAPLALLLPIVMSILVLHLTSSGMSQGFFLTLLTSALTLCGGQRNDYRFRSIPPSAVRLIAMIKGRLSFHLRLFAKRFKSPHRRSYFLRQWAANGMFGSFIDSAFVFTLH